MLRPRLAIALVFVTVSAGAIALTIVPLVLGSAQWGSAVWGAAPGAGATAIPALPTVGLIALVVLVALLPLGKRCRTAWRRKR